ncbi:MAG: hypothetical protein EBR02_00275 [Alphaproteobacteria bacterium]|nr:hypothetical protein [Alphaproteobacteria bacterium]
MAGGGFTTRLLDGEYTESLRAIKRTLEEKLGETGKIKPRFIAAKHSSEPAKAGAYKKALDGTGVCVSAVHFVNYDKIQTDNDGLQGVYRIGIDSLLSTQDFFEKTGINPESCNIEVGAANAKDSEYPPHPTVITTWESEIENKLGIKREKMSAPAK